jgi:tetratricopeptide (TPR) repeat protein
MLTYEFDEVTPVSALAVMTWEKVRVAFKIEVSTPKIVSESLRRQLGSRVQFEWQSGMEAANYLLDNKLDPDEALRYADQSIQNEDRFENEMTKARALTALGRDKEAVAARGKAFELGTQLQIQVFARNLQAQGRKKEALELFRLNIKKDPNTWIAHNETARLAAAEGDFDTAVKEMKLVLATAPASFKTQVEDLIRLLENRIDIN